MDAATKAWHDRFDAHIRHKVKTLGWTITMVGAGPCSAPGCDGCVSDMPFAYTIGLHGMGHPELLVFGLTPGPASIVLNTLAEQIADGARLEAGRSLMVPGWWQRFVPEEVPNPGEIVFVANDYYRRGKGRSVEVLQLTHDDLDGRFPWDAGYHALYPQPRPGEFTA